MGTHYYIYYDTVRTVVLCFELTSIELVVQQHMRKWGVTPKKREKWLEAIEEKTTAINSSVKILHTSKRNKFCFSQRDKRNGLAYFLIFDVKKPCSNGLAYFRICNVKKTYSNGLANFRICNVKKPYSNGLAYFLICKIVKKNLQQRSSLFSHL